MIKFSIITVCLNAGNDLHDTVRSVLEQDYDNFEIIVKDGNSSDGSVEKLPENNHHLQITRKADTGIYDAMNQGIDLATGDYLIFLNAGDKFPDKHSLTKMAECMKKSDVSLYYGRCYNETLKVNSNSPKNLTPFFCYRSMICHQAMIFEREYLQQKKFDCHYKVSADKEILMYTVVKEKLNTEYIPVIVANYKGSGFSESENNRKRIVSEIKQLQKQYFTPVQRFVYRFRIALTLPHIRKKIVRNPKLVRKYKKFVGMLYRNK